MCAVGRIHNGLKVVFCCMHATPSHYRQRADLLSCIEHIRCEILEACTNACWVHLSSVSDMWLVPSVAFRVFSVIYEILCVELSLSCYNREDIIITHLYHTGSINLSHCCIFPWLCAWGTIMCCMSYIPRVSWVLFLFINVQSYGVCKYSSSSWPSDHILLCVLYNTVLSSLRRRIWRHCT